MTTPSPTMDMSNQPTTAMSMSSSGGMTMFFFTSTSTPLFSLAWTPSSTGGYAATCVFLIGLAVITRGVLAAKSLMETSWMYKDHRRRYIVMATDEKGNESSREFSGAKKNTTVSTTAVLTVNGVDEKVRLVENALGGPYTGTMARPWRLSVDLPRACLVTLIGGLGYLLMLAVMTYNVGYFMSVLGGIFLGELLFGRYIGGNHAEDHH